MPLWNEENYAAFSGAVFRCQNIVRTVLCPEIRSYALVCGSNAVFISKENLHGSEDVSGVGRHRYI